MFFVTFQNEGSAINTLSGSKSRVAHMPRNEATPGVTIGGSSDTLRNRTTFGPPATLASATRCGTTSEKRTAHMSSHVRGAFIYVYVISYKQDICRGWGS